MLSKFVFASLLVYSFSAAHSVDFGSFDEGTPEEPETVKLVGTIEYYFGERRFFGKCPHLRVSETSELFKIKSFCKGGVHLLCRGQMECTFEGFYDEEEEEFEVKEAIAIKPDHLKDTKDKRYSKSGSRFRRVSQESLVERFGSKEKAEKFGEAWKAPNGVIWGDTVMQDETTVALLSQDEAIAYCKAIGARLPELEDWEALEQYLSVGYDQMRGWYNGINGLKGYSPEVLPNLHHGRGLDFWTPKIMANGCRDKGLVFSAWRGGNGYNPRKVDKEAWYKTATRCITK